MQIHGLVMAKHEGHAYKILEGLQNDYILDYFSLDDSSDPSTEEIETYFDGYVDKDGYLTLERDMDCFISKFVPTPPPGYHLYGFEAEYAKGE